jgi:hypothetical protein
MTSFRKFMLLCALLAGMAGVPASAADSDGNWLKDWTSHVFGEDASTTGQPAVREVTPASWPFALHLPATGELLVRSADGTGPEALGLDDVQWFNPDNKPGDGLVYALNGAYVEKPEIYLGAGTYDERLELYTTARYRELGKDMVGKPVTLTIAGRTWTRYQITDKVQGEDGQPIKNDKGETVSFDYLSYVTTMPTGFINVVFLFDYPPGPEAEVEGWAAKVLGAKAEAP